MTIPAGARLGAYEIVAALGAGGMGEVYQARDTRLAREVAIKVLPAEFASDASRLRRFESEARSASALNHPNIVTIYEIGSAEETSYIAMELVDGRTLRDLLLDGPMPTKKLLAIATQIAEGLARAHDAGIVHRDLKPENVMVTRDGLVKILDFGLAKASGTALGANVGMDLPTLTGTVPGLVVGTVGYMSPEQASADPVDFRSDQFSFGSILYELATGRRAFLGKTGVDTLSAILNDDPRPITEINPRAPLPLRWIVDRCLAKEPDARYASTKDLARDLAGVQSHLLEADLSGSAPALGRSQRRSMLWPAAGAAVLLTGALLAFLAVRTGGAGAPPVFRQLTFRQGQIGNARFAPDDQMIVFSRERDDGKSEILMTRVGSSESRLLGLPPAEICSISPSSEMAVILDANQTLATAPLGGGAPREILADVNGADWSPDGKGLVVAHAVDGKPRIEFPVGKVLYEGSDFILNPRFSPRGDRIAFNEGFGSLVVVDLDGKKQAFPSKGLTGYAWSSGEEIWYSEVAGGVTQFDAVTPRAKKRLLFSLPGEYNLADRSRDGRLLIERSARDRKIVGLLPGESRERGISGLGGAVPADISPDGKLVLFSEIGAGGGATGGVYLWRAETSQSVRLGDGIALALSPDGRSALSMRLGARSVLTLLPTGAGESRALPLAGVRLGKATFFPDGKRVLISGNEPGKEERLYVLDLEGGVPRPVGPLGSSFPDGAHGISPDGKRIVAFGPDEKIHIYFVEDGAVSPGKPVPGVGAGHAAIRWSADGLRIFVAGDGLKIFLVDPSTGQRELWNEFQPGDRESQIHNVLPTPDGKWYAYGLSRESSDLFLAEGVK